MNKDQVLGIIRHILTAAGAVLAIKGYTDEITATAIIGALMAAIGGIWSIFDKREANIVAKAEAILAKRLRD